MSEYLFLAPVAFIAGLMAIAGFYAKYRESREPHSGETMTVAFKLSDAQVLQRKADLYKRPA